MNEDTRTNAAATAADSSTKPLGDVIAINEGVIKDHLDKVVVATVQETLNAMLDAEADQLCGAKRYEHSADRVDTRAGHYERQLHTKAGEVTLKVPKLRSLAFESAIIERYKRREISVEEALVEMYLAGVSVRRVEDITQALWGTRVSPSTVSELNQKIAVQIEEWRVGDKNSIRESCCSFLRNPARKLIVGAGLLEAEWVSGTGGIEPARAKAVPESGMRRVVAPPIRTPQMQMERVHPRTRRSGSPAGGTFVAPSGGQAARRV